jgi:hypothetical protein
VHSSHLHSVSFKSHPHSAPPTGYLTLNHFHFIPFTSICHHIPAVNTFFANRTVHPTYLNNICNRPTTSSHHTTIYLALEDTTYYISGDCTHLTFSIQLQPSFRHPASFPPLHYTLLHYTPSCPCHTPATVFHSLFFYIVSLLLSNVIHDNSHILSLHQFLVCS